MAKCLREPVIHDVLAASIDSERKFGHAIRTGNKIALFELRGFANRARSRCIFPLSFIVTGLRDLSPIVVDLPIVYG